MSRTGNRRASSRGSNEGSSSSSSKKTSGYVTLFEVKKGDDGKEYLQINKSSDYVDIRVNGVSINGKTIYLNDPADKYDRMVDKGKMSEEEADEKISKIPEYILEEGTVKLD